MPRIRMRSTYAGPSGVHLAGSTWIAPASEARILIDEGYAEAVRDEGQDFVDGPPPEPSPETAAHAGGEEIAAHPPGRTRRRG